MDEDQQLLNQRTTLLPTGVPNSLDEALCSLWYRRQTRQVQQRIRHEDQTPMFPNGCGASHAVLMEAQRPLAVLIEGFRRPAVPIQADDLGGAPVRPVRDEYDIIARHLLVRKAHHDAHFTQAGDTDPPREAPVGLPTDGDGAIGIGRDQRHEVRNRALRFRQRHGPAVGIPPVNARRVQQAVLFEQADPVLPPSGQDLDHILRQIPGVKDHHATGHFAPDGLFDQVNRQRNFRPKLLLPCPKLGILEHDRGHLLMQAVPRFFVGREHQLWEMLGYRINSERDFDHAVNATYYQDILPSEPLPVGIEVVYQPCLTLRYTGLWPF